MDLNISYSKYTYNIRKKFTSMSDVNTLSNWRDKSKPAKTLYIYTCTRIILIFIAIRLSIVIKCMSDHIN